MYLLFREPIHFLSPHLLHQTDVFNVPVDVTVLDYSQGYGTADLF